MRPTDVRTYGSPESSGYGGESAPIDLLVRGFLKRGSASDAGYGYYSYLLFADNANATSAHRKAAAGAFMNLLEDTADAASLGHPFSTMAVLYAPVTAIPSARTADALLSSYDYSRAQLLIHSVQHAGAHVPRVALVASQTPLDASTSPQHVDVTDLCGDDATVQQKLLEFRKELLVAPGSLHAPGILERVRGFFESIGSAVAIEKEGKSESLPDSCPP